MFKSAAVLLMVVASVMVKASPGIVAPVAIHSAPVLAHSSQVIARNYNGVVAAPIIAAPVVKAVHAPLVAAPVAYSSPIVKAVAPIAYSAPIVKTFASPLAYTAPIAYAAGYHSPHAYSYSYFNRALPLSPYAKIVSPLGYSALPAAYAAAHLY